MRQLVFFALIFAVLCAIVMPLWLLVERRANRKKRIEAKREECDRLRQLLHAMRKHVTPEQVQDVRDTCRSYGLEYDDIGTTCRELDDLHREAHLFSAAKFFAGMGEGHDDPSICMSKIIEHLHHARRPYDWGAIDTTMSDLRELYHKSLIARARKLREQMRRGDCYVTDTHKEGEIEALLILANAAGADSYPPNESDSVKKA